jgi:integration host factor subunit alpha
MTKSEIAERVQSKTGFTKKESSELLESMFTVMKSTLEAGETLKISGFGIFAIKRKNDRKGRNPQTGEEITIKARQVLTFKPSAVLRNAVNGVKP